MSRFGDDASSDAAWAELQAWAAPGLDGAFMAELQAWAAAWAELQEQADVTDLEADLEAAGADVTDLEAAGLDASDRAFLEELKSWASAHDDELDSLVPSAAAHDAKEQDEEQEDGDE